MNNFIIKPTIIAPYNPPSYLSRCFLSAFARCLPLNVLRYVYDALLFGGDEHDPSPAVGGPAGSPAQTLKVFAAVSRTLVLLSYDHIQYPRPVTEEEVLKILADPWGEVLSKTLDFKTLAEELRKGIREFGDVHRFADVPVLWERISRRGADSSRQQGDSTRTPAGGPGSRQEQETRGQQEESGGGDLHRGQQGDHQRPEQGTRTTRTVTVEQDEEQEWDIKGLDVAGMVAAGRGYWGSGSNDGGSSGSTPASGGGSGKHASGFFGGAVRGVGRFFSNFLATEKTPDASLLANPVAGMDPFSLGEMMYEMSPHHLLYQHTGSG